MNVYELVTKTEENLLGLTNFGRKSLNEVKGILQQMGLSVDMNISESIITMIEKNSEIIDDSSGEGYSRRTSTDPSDIEDVLVG